MVIAPKAGDPFEEQDPAYFLLWHDFLASNGGVRYEV